MKYVLVSFLVILPYSILPAQESDSFEEEIAKIKSLNPNGLGPVTVFVGSSSIRLWEDLSSDCDQMNLINTGFGGSQMSDLLFYLEETVLRFKPETIYIYEGDNDIKENKSPETILETAKKVVQRIKTALPKAEIYFISAKPSPSRWHLRNQYLIFNKLLKEYCATDASLNYIDVWNPMLDELGSPKSSIFIEDSLHMNRKGYNIWKSVICNMN